MGNQGSSPHEPLDRARNGQTNDLKMKSSSRTSFRRGRAAAGGTLSPPRAGMERLRRSFRESFRRRKGADAPESARPHQWHADEAAVRAGTCTFPVKYLGCVEVFESRGMQVCEEALKVLRNSRRRPVRAVLHVSGDGLRVVEEETKGLIVDQTIEKVSFCAPDRNHERGFSYICRDGTTRRWMCHGFLSSRDSGERLSHAVGCAFAACLERKQRRDKECAVSMSIDAASSAFTRHGSFRKSDVGLPQEYNDEQGFYNYTLQPFPKPLFTPTDIDDQPPVIGTNRRMSEADVTSVGMSAVKPTPHNPFAVERPHAAPHLLERQGSVRGFAHLNNNSPFKRQMSLRITELPSNLERRERSGLSAPTKAFTSTQPAQPQTTVQTIEESTADSEDAVTAMCAALSSGLRALTEEPVPVVAPTPLPAPDQWLGRIVNGQGAPGAGVDQWPNKLNRAPPLSASTRAASFAGQTTTNPFLTTTPL